MWEHAGILRDEQGLQAGLDRLADLREQSQNMDVGPLESESFEYAVDVGFMLTVAETILRGALKRTESRGAHYRTDYPDTDTDWRCNIYYEMADLGRLRSYTDTVESPSEAVQAALDEGHELDYHQLE
jgi:succinate dehydrogenase / fumarate reductase flavoprotein subunit